MHVKHIMRYSFSRSSTVLGITVATANEFCQHEVISASDIDCPLAKIPVSLSTTGQELWAFVSFDRVCTIISKVATILTWLSKSG